MTLTPRSSLGAVALAVGDALRRYRIRAVLTGFRHIEALQPLLGDLNCERILRDRLNAGPCGRLVKLGLGSPWLRRQWAERGWRDSALRGGFVGRGDLQEDVLSARLGPEHQREG